MSAYNVIIMLPGTTGSTLIDTANKNKLVWPITSTNNLMSLDPAIEAKDLESSRIQVDSVCAGYAPLLASLNKMVGVNQAQAVNPNLSTWGLTSNVISSATVFAFPYDWRNDNIDSAISLQNFLSYINGSSVGNIYFVAHSMGGIVVRTYLELIGRGNNPKLKTNTNTIDPWYGKIAGLATFATPHLGAPLALDPITGTKIQIPNVSTIEQDYANTLAWDFVDNTYGNSTFELLPVPASNFLPEEVSEHVNFISSDNKSYNVFSLPTDINTVLNNSTPHMDAGDIQINIASASVLLNALEVLPYSTPNPTPKLPPYYCIYGITNGSTDGSDTSTITSYTYTPAHDFIPTKWTPTMGAGDSVVPEWSAVFTGYAQASNVYQAVGDITHFTITSNPEAQNQVATWFNLTLPNRIML